MTICPTIAAALAISVVVVRGKKKEAPEGIDANSHETAIPQLSPMSTGKYVLLKDQKMREAIRR